MDAIVAPSGYSIVSDIVTWGGYLHASCGGEDDSILISLWAAPDGSPASPAFGSYSGSITTTHGVSETYTYTGNRIPG